MSRFIHSSIKLQSMCYTLQHTNSHVEMINTKDQIKQSIVFAVYVNTVNTKIKACNALNAMYADTVDTHVCGFYTTPYTV